MKAIFVSESFILVIDVGVPIVPVYSASTLQVDALHCQADPQGS